MKPTMKSTRKATILVLGVLAAGLARAGTPVLPEGTFAGTATWLGKGGTSGTYTVEKTFSNGTITEHFTWTQPQKREETHTMTLALKQDEPFFEVLDDKKAVVGSGYCYDDTCSYHAVFGPITVNETFRWSRGSMDVTGSKSGPGFSVAWKESLKSR